MLQIVVPGIEEWDEAKEEFCSTKDQTLQLEHSLISLSKWESKYCKPFLSQENRTVEETIDYIKFMTLTPNVKPDVYNRLSMKNLQVINEYIVAPMTATFFSEDKSSKRNSEIITSELIYYWMVALQIPFDPCQKWHLNRLITLIRVCNVKNQPAKKMSKRDVTSKYAAINAARRKKLNTKG